MVNYFNNLNILNKNFLFKAYIISAYSILFFSVGENIVNINFNGEIFRIKNILAIRSISPYLILTINLFILLKIKSNNLIKIDNVILFFLLIIISQYLGLFLSIDREYLALNHFLFGSLATITTFYLILLDNDNKIITQVLLITIFFFILIISIFIFQNPNISYGGGSIRFYGKQLYYLNSNGFSRYLVFIYIIFFCKFIFSKKNYSIKFLIPLIFISSLIFTYEGRVNIFTLIILNLFIFFYSINIKKKIISFVILLILPILFSNYIKNIRDYKGEIINLKKILNFNIRTTRLQQEGKTFTLKQYFDHAAVSSNDLTTGRMSKWKEILEYDQTVTNYIFGNGPEFDRVILEKKDLILFGNDAANSLLYLYLCGGFIGLFIILIFGLYQLYLFYFALVNLSKINDIYFSICIKIFIFVALRSFFENSYVSWSIDQIIFILTALYWNKYLKKYLKNTF